MCHSFQHSVNVYLQFLHVGDIKSESHIMSHMIPRGAKSISPTHQANVNLYFTDVDIESYSFPDIERSPHWTCEGKKSS